MDTTKSAKASTNVEEADDLIEELARLMADDAQINAPTPKPVAKPSPTPRIKPSAPDATNVSTQQAPTFDLKGFDLGAPTAQTSPIQAPSADQAPSVKQAPSANIVDTKPATPPAASEEASEPTKEFQFNFGSEAEEQKFQQPAAQTEDISKPAEAPQIPITDDPIADLINAAVQKHDAAGEATPATPIQEDSFDTPPVFGVTAAEAPVAPTPPAPEKPIGGSVALDEIEALIGSSVQVKNNEGAGDSFAQQAVEGPTIAPQPLDDPLELAPLESQSSTPDNIATLPSDPSDTPDVGQAHPDSAEGAILQAMAAAGTATAAAALVNNDAAQSTPSPEAKIQTTANEQPHLAPGRGEKPKKKKAGVSSFLLPMLGILVVGALGVGAYFWLNPAQNSGDAPVLIADQTPTRATPAQVEAEPESVVLNQIDGASTASEPENLVSRDQTNGANGNSVRQVVTTDNSEAGLANRRVRTVTVRPDGTIISGDDGVAGGAVLPVAQPNLPDLPANAVNTVLSNTTVTALPTSAADSVNVETVTVNGSSVPFPKPRLTDRSALAALARSTVAGAQLPVSTGVSVSNEPATSSSAAVDLIANTAASAVAPVVNIVEPTPVVEAPVATTPVAAAPTTVSNPQAYVQLASQRSQSIANQTARDLQARYASALNGGQLAVRRVDLGTRGVYYRVQLPTSTLRSANSICNAVKNSGGDCFTRSN